MSDKLCFIILFNSLLKKSQFWDDFGDRGYMSDKLFFKGRQDARQNHIKYGHKTKNTNKAGSKKHPLTLTVTSEARKLEVEILVAEANVFADISVDSSEGAVESIVELTMLLNKHEAVTVDKVPGRNDPCICGSGNKYKKCCG